MKKRIMHLVNTGNYSGLENVVMNISKLEKNHEHIYVSPKGKINSILEKNNVQHIDVKKISCCEIARLIVQENPDIIHAHDVTASAVAAMLSFRYKKKIISHLHSNDPAMKRFSQRWLIYTLAIPRFNNIFVVSKSVKNEYKGNFLKNSVILENIVSLDDEKYQKLGKSYDLIMVGRLEIQKDPLKFLTILKRVKQKIPNLKAAYVGDGSIREEFLENVNSLGLQDTIDYLGFLEDPYSIMAKSKIFILTSQYEGFGLVALEAMLLGLPAVVSNVGGLPSIVDSDSGLVSNNTDDQVNEVIKLLQSESYYKNKSIHAKEKATRINNVEKFLNKLQQVYE